MPNCRERVVSQMRRQAIALGSEHADVGGGGALFKFLSLLGLPLVLGVFGVVSLLVVVRRIFRARSHLEELREERVCVLSFSQHLMLVPVHPRLRMPAPCVREFVSLVPAL